MPAPTAITDPKWIARLYKAIPEKNRQTRQDIFLVMLALGAHVDVVARPAEHLATFDGRVVTFQRTKTAKICRIVAPEVGHFMPVPSARIHTAIRRWLDPTERTTSGFPTSRKTIDTWIRRLGKKAGYPRPLPPGAFRHTFCYQDLKAHKDLLRTTNKMQCSMRMIQDNYGLLDI